MMKKIFSIALLSAALFAAPSFAQTTATSSCDSTAKKECASKKECKDSKQCKSDKKKGDRKFNGDKKSNRGPAVSAEQRFNNEFEGLNLSDTQKTQLKNLKENQRKEMQARREAAKADRKQAKEEAKADRKAMKKQRDEARRAYLKEVKNIVGDENYVIFLENQYVNAAPRDNNKMKSDMRSPGFNHKSASKMKASKMAKHAKVSKEVKQIKQKENV